MTKEELQKERRDWWKTVYLERLAKDKAPEKAADKALRIFDNRFKEVNDKPDKLNEYHKKELKKFHELISNIDGKDKSLTE